jgi:hypothetical protein
MKQETKQQPMIYLKVNERRKQNQQEAQSEGAGRAEGGTT